MFASEKKRASLAAKVIKELGDHALTKSHARHLDADKCRSIGLVIEALDLKQASPECDFGRRGRRGPQAGRPAAA
jgi:hypothetical protein